MSEKPNIVRQITEAAPSYSRAFKKLADFILQNTFACSSMSIEELAAAAEVSIATVSRFANECGFEGYALFRAELRSVFEKVFEPAEKLRRGVLRRMSEEEVLEDSLDNLLLNIESSRQLLSSQALTQALDLMLSAKHIFVAGMGVSALHATFMVEGLEPFLSHTIQELNSLGGPERAFRKVGMLGAEDLMIAISLPRYSKSTIELVHLAKSKGAKVLSITDAPTSPIVPLADIALFAPSTHPVLYASNAPILALIEGLCAAVALRVNHSAEYLAQQTESVLPYFYMPSSED